MENYNIIERLEDDKELDFYYDLTDDEQENYHKEILNFANENRSTMIDYIHKIKIVRFSPLDPIYSALATDPENWGDFLFEEHKRVFKIAKNSKKTHDVLESLEFYFNYENQNFQFKDNIIQYLASELEHPNDAVRYQSLSLLDEWIDDVDFPKYRHIIELMAKRKDDKNWKVRNLTFIIFTGRPLLPNVEFKQSFLDKLRVKGFLFDSQPYRI